jgi:phenylpropionate dioxygenase-like ring-hydroxylating dioxygenase large terminal subunit
MTNWAELVDLERQTVSPRVFVDQEIYRDEQERIFGHCWLYVAHESQLPQPGDYLTHYMSL